MVQTKCQEMLVIKNLGFPEINDNKSYEEKYTEKFFKFK